MAISFVQANGSNGAGSITSLTLAYLSNVTSGDILLMIAVAGAGSAVPSSVTSTATSGNWTVVANTNGAVFRSVATSTGPCTITANFSSSAGSWQISCCEYSGQAASPIDTGGNNNGVSGTISTTISAANTNETYVMFSEVGLASSSISSSAGSNIRLNGNTFNISDQTFSGSGSNTIQVTVLPGSWAAFTALLIPAVVAAVPYGWRTAADDPMNNIEIVGS